jgi:hypothetical protein
MSQERRKNELGVDGQRRGSGGSVDGGVARGVELGSLYRRRVERWFAHANETTKSRHGRGVRRQRAVVYTGDTSGRAARRVHTWRERGGEKGGGRTTQSPYACHVDPVGLDVCVGPRYGSAAAAHVPGAVRRALECRASVGGVGIWFDVFQLSFSQNFETKVDHVLNSKVVDQLTLYNFYKGRIGF